MSTDEETSDSGLIEVPMPSARTLGNFATCHCRHVTRLDKKLDTIQRSVEQILEILHGPPARADEGVVSQIKALASAKRYAAWMDWATKIVAGAAILAAFTWAATHIQWSRLPDAPRQSNPSDRLGSDRIEHHAP